MDDPLVHERLREQVRRNQATRGAWQRFAPHRRRITDLLTAAVQAAKRPRRLAVLGAGNCNDLDLSALRTQFAAIDLVDCDRDAVLQGIDRQGLAADSAIQAIGPIDLSRWAEFDSSTSASYQPLPLPIPQADIVPQADVVASLCLLSQILESLALALGASHPRFLELVQQERSSHFRLMIDHLLPGGTGLFATDLVSSDTTPQLVDAKDVALSDLVRTCIECGNFFTGLNPAVIHSLLRTDADVAPKITDVVMVPPWTWDLGPRVYLVYAVRFRRLTAG
ncbi:MAG: hypothetical protein L0211_14690 [Planctomycetaceae bacterium]|nr:hypothetical protein [Planctomycetaceae bacterium]